MTNAPRIVITGMAIVMVSLLVAGGLMQIGFAHHRPGHSGGPSVVSEPNTKVRALQDGNSLDGDAGNEGLVPGSDIDCVAGIDTSGAADEVKCYLVPDGVPTPDYATGYTEVMTSTIEGSCPSGVGFTSGDVCFTMTFDDADFTNGHWRFVAEFYKNGQLVDINGSNFWTNHTFFVIPESPIGAAALVGSSLAALGAYMYLRSRNSASILSSN